MSPHSSSSGAAPPTQGLRPSSPIPTGTPTPPAALADMADRSLFASAWFLGGCAPDAGPSAELPHPGGDPNPAGGACGHGRSIALRKRLVPRGLRPRRRAFGRAPPSRRGPQPRRRRLADMADRSLLASAWFLGGCAPDARPSAELPHPGGDPNPAGGACGHGRSIALRKRLVPRGLRPRRTAFGRAPPSRRGPQPRRRRLRTWPIDRSSQAPGGRHTPLVAGGFPVLQRLAPWCP
ncbi:MAG: hypothetical protein JJLCMIEE_02407 [Acidimicrobiales bacterium]|nr:hypothetical protein [Acidimicrobiales bacterium]